MLYLYCTFYTQLSGLSPYIEREAKKQRGGDSSVENTKNLDIGEEGEREERLHRPWCPLSTSAFYDWLRITMNECGRAIWYSYYCINGRSCNGIEEALERYRELVPQVHLAGPTSFAPIIGAAIDIVESSGRQYHVLLIVADGQVTRSSDTEIGQLSIQEQETIDAIVKASAYPLSIVVVGVGDGPWDMMYEFDDNIPHRAFDNFQFVSLTEILTQEISFEKMRSEIALAALMEIPSQYLATLELPGLSHAHERGRIPLPPPSIHQQSPLPYLTDQQPHDESATAATSSNSRVAEDTHDEVTCPICLENRRDLVFGCGHLTCQECGSELSLCPICRTPITVRIKLFS
ncbi:hypothetical protein MKW94_016889 [Papaver nudicaule]|uniref:RING-type domain-containing protein n=1 Tax=Papaver nudicaule TaxID=74823 RepID=A0AA41VC41_PAPNU|nr:hypothetical protein [Papaver nudicaule]